MTTNIDELLLKSGLKTDILSIAVWLRDDPNYTKEKAIDDLIQLIEKHNL